MSGVLINRAAESWRIEGPKGFGKRTVKYFLRLGRPVIGEPIGVYASQRTVDTLDPEEEERPRSSGVFGLVQQDLARVEETLESLTKSDFPFLARALDHVLSAGGKRIRPAIALLAGRLGRYDLDQLVPLAASIELLHSATLVHDDVDRRGADATRPRDR